jgi:hypothetical protein
MSDDLGAADERARAEWEDGAGEECATTAGVWHAAIAYERGRVAALTQEGQSEEAIAGRALREFSARVAPLQLPCFFWIGLPKTNDSMLGGSGDMDEDTRERMLAELLQYFTNLPPP